MRDKSDASLAVAAQNLRESLNGAEQLARSQGKSVQEVSGGIRGALSSAQGIVSRLAALRGAAAKMSVIAETFTGVADQANILSLNLSIETAKSGIKGSGLGTLAEQVKILSKRTVVSVIDIESIRDSILETLDAGANDTDSFLSALESDSKILDEIDAALSELTLMLSKISAETNGISASLRGRAGSDSTVQEAMENLARVDAARPNLRRFPKTRFPLSTGRGSVSPSEAGDERLLGDVGFRVNPAAELFEHVARARLEFAQFAARRFHERGKQLLLRRGKPR